MARQALKEKLIKQKRLAKRYEKKRSELKAILENRSLEPDAMEAKVQAQFAFQALPRNSAKNRQRNRCALDGRPRGYIGYFGISRLAFRKLASLGVLPGVKKVSL